VRAFATKDEAIRFAGRQLGEHYAAGHVLFRFDEEMREEPEQPVKLPHLHNLGSPAYLELSGTMVGRAGLHLWRGSRFCCAKNNEEQKG
jgi:hypothetical protein